MHNIGQTPPIHLQRIDRIDGVYSIENNGNQSGAIALRPEINWRTKILSWQDTTFHPKTFRFDKMSAEAEKLIFKKEGQSELQLTPLTIEFFKRYINWDVPQEALANDQELRIWFLDFAAHPPF